MFSHFMSPELPLPRPAKISKWLDMAASKPTNGLDGNLRYPLDYPQRQHLADALHEAATWLAENPEPHWWQEHAERYQAKIAELEEELGQRPEASPCAGKPLLRPFAALREPLPDTTVPAIEVAKLLVNDWANEYRYHIAGSKSPTGQNFTVQVCAWTPEVGEVMVCRVSFTPDWNWIIYNKWTSELRHLENIGKAVDYLRNLGFAYDLEPHEFIAR